MLNIPDLKNIQYLPVREKDFIKNLMDPKSGGKELIKLSGEGKEEHLAMSAVEFKMHGEKYTLVSLQDITNELERERMANEFEIAHRVQTRLLPKTDPEIKGYSISAVCLPAKEVGGDYYDYIDLKDGKTGIVIGDVAGKGMPAAFYMTLTKGIFQACAAQDESPKEVLIKLNEIICKSMIKGSFVTLIYAVLDPAANTVRFVRAGHEPLLVYKKKENKIYEFKPSGMGVGLDCGSLFRESIEECEVKLDKDDIIIFYTDGLVDLRNSDNREFDHDRFNKCILKNSLLDAPEFSDAIVQELKNYKGDVNQFDDLTMIAIKSNSDK